MAIAGQWEEERVFFSGDEYFAAVEQALDRARAAIDIEIYDFEYDTVGKKIAGALLQAAERGVSVRVIVDSIGSLTSKESLRKIFSERGVEFQVYHELPWEHVGEIRLKGEKRNQFIEVLFQLNKRTHRKIILIDHERCFLGGMNISDVHLRSIHGPAAWRDSAVMVRGADVSQLVLAFQKLWMRKMIRRRLSPKTRRLTRLRPTDSLVRLNYTRRLRRRSFVELYRRILRAEKRIWITTAYFVPHRTLVRALQRAARNGVDVRLLLPERSDVFFMPWVAWALYRPLLGGGVKIFDYLPTVLHAKTTIIDDWMIIGSSNFNSRSLIHDLEVDVLLTHESSKQAVVKQFADDLSVSHQISISEEPKRRFWQRLFGQVVLSFRYWL